MRIIMAAAEEMTLCVCLTHSLLGLHTPYRLLLNGRMLALQPSHITRGMT
jgi:hypothetical protein